jgi:hypothetical protein
MQSQQSTNQSENKEQSSVDLNQIPQPQLTGHSWRQQGTMIICQSCPFTHTSTIPIDYQLYGIDKEGMPLIRKLEF